jgi:signal recognition particle subunit SRP19
MVSRDEDKYVIWPVYFDKSVSKLGGRKVPKKHAVENPSLENIAKAAKSLGLHPVLEKNCAQPSKHWKKEGRLLVDKKELKSKMLVQIANRL